MKTACLLGVVSLAVVHAGCGAAEPETQAPTGPLSSQAGLYLGQLAFEPDPPSVGKNDLSLWLEADGHPVVGAGVRASAYMPAHGHSTDNVEMSELAPGRYRTDALVYSMPGTWELTLSIATDAGGDLLTFQCDVR